MADEPKKKSGMKWIILLVLLIIIGGAAFAVWHFGLLNSILGTGGSSEPVVQKVETQPMGKPSGTIISLPPFTVNLADPLGQRFIKINLDVEVANQRVSEELSGQNARIRDSIILLLSSRSYADIQTVESKLMLKNEIVDRLNNILGKGKVYQVFITDMVIQ